MKLTIIEKNNGPLTKIIRFKGGSIEKDSSECWLSDGKATQTDTTLEKLAKEMRKIQPNQALIHGINRHQQINILSEKKFTGQADTITRTKEHFFFPDGEGSAFFDHDPKPGQKAYSKNDFMRTMAEVFPDVQKMAHVWTPSTSSCIFKDGKELVGQEGGMHIYFAVKNAADLPRFSEVLFKRLWLAGHGYIFITKDGKQLERTIFDKTVFSPERLDFVAGAVCKDGLEQKLPDPAYTDGNVLDTSLLPDLDEQQEAEYMRFVAEAKGKTASDAGTVRGEYVSVESEKLVKKGIPSTDAKRIVDKRIGGDLAGKDILYFDREGEKTVEQVLNDPESYDKKTLRDPLEHDYGPHKAIFYANLREGKPVVYSQAHGGRTFFLQHDGNDWPELLPLLSKIMPEPYPVDALPCTIRAAVEEVAGFVKAPLPLVASSALSALSVAVQAHVDMKRAEKLHGPSTLFLLTVADSGERKTTCDGFFTSAIDEYEKERAELAKPELKRHAAEIATWEAKRSGLLAAIKDGAKGSKDTSKQENVLRDLEDKKPTPPAVPRLLLGDETPENLAWTLAKGWPSAGVVSSEAGVVFGAHGMGKDSIMRNLGLLNILWDGGVLSVGRRTSESFTVRGARLTLGLQIQEAPLRSFFDRSGGLARGTGFLARFLVAWPESTQGERPFTEPPETWPRLEAFQRRIEKILLMEVKVDDEGRLTPASLSFTQEAKAAWVAFHDEIEGELRSGGELYDVRDVASKTADNAGRLAALFQVFEDGSVGAVGLEALEGASRIAAWHLNEARRFFGELALPEELANAARLEAWLLEYCRRERKDHVQKNHVRQHGPGQLRNKEKLERAITELEELGRVRMVREVRPVEIQVRPTLLEGVAS